MTTSVPVLIYHHINPNRGDTVTITPEAFTAQMEYLAANGIRTLTVAELLDFIAGRLTLTERAVLLTFDDGWLDNYVHAWPVLQRYGLQATFFLITDRTDRAGQGGFVPPRDWPRHDEAKRLLQEKDAGGVAMGWRHVREMAASGLCRFYSHTRRHRKCDEIYEPDLREELNGSRRVMEQRLGDICDVLCWPYGRFSPAAVEVAVSAGYRTLFTTRACRVVQGDDPLRLPRIEASESIETFIQLLEGA